jgi:hypothetical protein
MMKRSSMPAIKTAAAAVKARESRSQSPRVLLSERMSYTIPLKTRGKTLSIGIPKNLGRFLARKRHPIIIPAAARGSRNRGSTIRQRISS